MTALPAAATFTASSVTEADFKMQLTNLISYLSGLLDTPGTTISALQKLGALGNAVLSKSAAYTVTAADRGKLIDCTGTWTLSLTAAATLGNFAFAVRNSGSGTITIDPDLSETVDGATTITLAAGESCIVVCNGTAFYTVGKSTGYVAGDNITIAGNVISNTTGWKPITSGSIGAVVSFDLALDTSLYSEFRLRLDGVIPATDGAYVQAKPLYGASVLGGSAGYAQYVSKNSTEGAATGLLDQFPIIIGFQDSGGAEGIGTAASEHGHCVVLIGGFGQSLPSGVAFESMCGFVDAAGEPAAAKMSAAYTWNGTVEQLITGLRIAPSAGSFEAAGTYVLEGFKR